MQLYTVHKAKQNDHHHPLKHSKHPKVEIGLSGKPYEHYAGMLLQSVVKLRYSLVKEHIMLWAHAHALANQIHFSANVTAIYDCISRCRWEEASQNWPAHVEHKFIHTYSTKSNFFCKSLQHAYTANLYRTKHPVFIWIQVEFLYFRIALEKLGVDL